MNERQSKQAAEDVVGAIQKDFKIVGTSRVHSWYAWAIIGIVLGMALGVVYVANRSGEFVASQAAGIKITVSGTDGRTGYIHKVGVRNSSFIADAGAIPTATGQTVTTGPGLDFSFAGTNVRTIYNFDGDAISAVFVSSDRSQATLGARSGQKINIGSTPFSVTVDGNRKTDFVFKGIYINPKNQKKTGTITGALTAGIDIAGTYGMEGSGRTRTITGETPVTVPWGMPLYANTPISITLDGSTRKFTDKTLLLPRQIWSGTWTLTFRDKDKKGSSDGDVEIVKAEFDPTPTFVIKTHNNTLPAQTLKPGLKMNRVITVVLSAHNGNAKLSRLTFRDTTAGTPSTAKQSFTNFYLYDGATKVTGPVEADANNLITFNLFGPLGMPAQGIQQTMALTLYGDVTTDAIPGSKHVFSVTPADVSVGSGILLVEGSATGNVMTIGSTPATPTPPPTDSPAHSLSVKTIGNSTARVRTLNDSVYRISLSAPAQYGWTTVKTLTLQLSGGIFNGINGSQVSAQLFDPTTNAYVSAINEVVVFPGQIGVPCNSTPTAACAITFKLNKLIASGDTWSVDVRIDSRTFAKNSLPGEAGNELNGEILANYEYAPKGGGAQVQGNQSVRVDKLVYESSISMEETTSTTSTPR